MFPLEVDGEEYRYVFVDADGGFLNWDDRETLLRETIRLNREGGKSRNVKGEEFEGRIQRGKFTSYNTFSGRSYEAKLESQKGKKDVSIMVLREIEPSYN